MLRFLTAQMRSYRYMRMRIYAGVLMCARTAQKSSAIALATSSRVLCLAGFIMS